MSGLTITAARDDDRWLTVSGMAAVLGFNRQHMYDLIRGGVFPPPVYMVTTRQPCYPAELQERCLEILRSGVGDHGRRVLFYNKRRRPARRCRPASPASAEAVVWTERLKEMGIKVDARVVEDALAQLKGHAMDVAEDHVVMRHLLRRFDPRWRRPY